MKKIISIIILTLYVTFVTGQFAPAAGEQGSTAIHKDDVVFKGWAKSCHVTRGFINLSDTGKTFTQNQVTSNRAFFGTEAMATGKAGGALDCISLGDGGTAVLTFDFPIRDGEGADFAIFENGMREQEPPFQYFLELAFVEVSTDGKRYVRFPAISNTPVNGQLGTFGQIDPRNIHNFAGKYVANYGTPFDLSELKDSAGINTDSINFIRLIDVVGSINPLFARYDSKGQIINDPFPTEFWSGGFDLDAVGVIHFNLRMNTQLLKNEVQPRIFPNPANRGEQLYVEAEGITSVRLWSACGKMLCTSNYESVNQASFYLPALHPGMYFLQIRSAGVSETVKLMIQ